MIRPLLGMSLLLLVTGCGGGSNASTTTAGDTTAMAAPPVATAALDMTAQGLPLTIIAPDKQYTGGAEPVVKLNEESGQWEVRAGDHFGLSIVEDAGDVARMKGDLERDLLRKNTIVRETPDLLVVRSEFPDDPSLISMHFYRIVRAGERSFVVQDLPDGKFNQQDIDRMVDAVAGKQPA